MRRREQGWPEGARDRMSALAISAQGSAVIASPQRSKARGQSSYSTTTRPGRFSFAPFFVRTKKGARQRGETPHQSRGEAAQDLDSGFHRHDEYPGERADQCLAPECADCALGTNKVCTSTASKS